MAVREWLPVAALLALSVLIGLLPGPLLAVVEPAAAGRRGPGRER